MFWFLAKPSQRFFEHTKTRMRSPSAVHSQELAIRSKSYLVVFSVAFLFESGRNTASIDGSVIMDGNGNNMYCSGMKSGMHG